jgi:hypothetical protein
MITIQVSVSKGWLYKEGGFSFPEKYYFDPLYRWEQDRKADRFLESMFPDLPIYNMESNLVQADYFESRQILIGGIQPNMILGAALGAKLICPPDKDADIDGKPLAAMESVEELPPPQTLLKSEIIELFDTQIEQIKKKHPELRPIPPFFWDSSGRATIHGLITTAQKLFGEKVFLMMIENPVGLSEILAWITDIYILSIEHYAALTDMDITSIHIGECSAAMISGQQFEETILEQNNRLAEVCRSVRMHSCGFSDHLLEAFSKIKNLAVIDTGSNTSVAKIREIMGKDFIINIAPPVDVLSGMSSDKRVESWLEQTLRENAGGPLQIEFHIEADYSMEKCLRVFAYLKENNIRVNRIKN